MTTSTPSATPGEGRRMDDLTFYSLLAVLEAGMWLLNDLESFLKPYGLSHGRFSILLAVTEAADGFVHPADVARNLGRSRPTITRMSERLQAERLIRVSGDELDGRVKRISLTPAGVKLLDEVIPRYNERVRAVTADLTDSNKHNLLNALSRLRLADPTHRIRVPS